MWSYLFVFLLSFLFHLSLIFSGSLPLSCFPVFHTLKRNGKEINAAEQILLCLFYFYYSFVSVPKYDFFCHVLLVSIVSQQLVQKLKVKWNCWQIESTAKHATDSEGRKLKYATGKTPVKAFWCWKKNFEMAGNEGKWTGSGRARENMLEVLGCTVPISAAHNLTQLHCI